MPCFSRVGRALLVAWALIGGSDAVASTSNRPVGMATGGAPPVALKPPAHVPMPSVERPARRVDPVHFNGDAAGAAHAGVRSTGAGHESAGAAGRIAGGALFAGPTAEGVASPSPRLLHPREASDRPLATNSGRSPGGAGWWFNTAWALAVVVAIIVALRFVLQRMGQGRAVPRRGAVMEIVGRVATGPRSAVLAVKIGHRIVVVGQTAAGLTTLADLSDPNEVASVLAAVSVDRPGSVSRGFESVFNNANRRYDDEIRADDEVGDISEFGIDRARDEVGGLLSRVRSMVGRVS